jgi:DNA repair protein RadC
MSFFLQVVWCTIIPPAIRPPSQADIQMTKAIVVPLGISVHDHIIVGRNGRAS